VRKPAPLAFGQIAILHAIAAGNRFGFDIMDATGLTSGTVYPTLDRFESLGYVTSHWEDPRTGKRRNLGTFKTRAAAEAHERAVQFFKRRG